MSGQRISVQDQGETCNDPGLPDTGTIQTGCFCQGILGEKKGGWGDEGIINIEK